MIAREFKTVRLILGDQLNHAHSWFKETDDDVLYLIAEYHSEAIYVKHHIQKLCAFFAAMECFAKELTEHGHHVAYFSLDDHQCTSPVELAVEVCAKVSATSFEYQRPDEYRLLTQFEILDINNCAIRCVDSEHFLVPFEELEQHIPANKHVLMEHFYRKMRKRYAVLVDEEGKPFGGKWNLDGQNRNKLKKADLLEIPEPLIFSNNVDSILERLKRRNILFIGTIDNQLLWPINRNQALNLVANFVRVCLPRFGTFQDAMTTETDSKWSLYHSRVSFALNTKMLSPLEVVHAAIEGFYNKDLDIELNQIEGFVRQIIGWREYVRGVYWANMPDYATRNALSAKRDLPTYFWNGDTKMRCMSEAIGQSLEYTYAHHIQRLMVTGNFALITELEPSQVDEWYLGIYIDAIEWVEMPNTRGMALFADDGIIATKPYAASGAYINRMSDYCSKCAYKVKDKVGDDACPLNSLYWRFMVKHRERLARNPRIGMIYRNWDRLDDSVQAGVLEQAERNLNRIERL